VAGDAPVVGRIIARIVENPATGLFRCGGRHAFECIGGVHRLAAAIGDVRHARGLARAPAYAGPLRVRPGGEVAPADAEIYAVVRNSHIIWTGRVLLDELLELLGTYRTQEEIGRLLVRQQKIEPGSPTTSAGRRIVSRHLEGQAIPPGKVIRIHLAGD